ncbi:TnsA-like heteromeric transposase endonuclease subunit [Kitasatospora sp. CMC57]|uniref:TnsA-like heteromeric transposase endonuclease subunit n=1 Tax=Kitasatospora sp. CMC57 TaxID=3231513 RepID=UPI0038B64EC4
MVGSFSVSLRRDDGAVREGSWAAGASDPGFASAVPWRTFRWRHGQQHYSGTYWSSTMSDHVIYESRLELTRLLYADFDQDTESVFAQPFLLTAQVGRRTCRHVPDFLMLRRGRVPLVVDVKPRHLLTRPKVSSALGWAREVVESRGWEFEVWSEPPDAELANLRFLAGYRRPWLFDADLLAEVRRADLDGVTLGQAFRAFADRPRELVRAAVLHLMWSQHLVTDLATPLTARHRLRVGGDALVAGAGSRDLPRPVDEDRGGASVDVLRERLLARGGGGRMGGAAVRVGVGTRFVYDGEVVVVEEMFGSAHGNEVLVRDRRERRLRLSLREVLSSGRAWVVPDGLGPASDEPRETASVILAQLSDAALEEVRERAADVNEILTGYRSGSEELAGPGEPRPEYTEGVGLMRRYEAKAAERQVSVRTVKRWVAAAHREREAALAGEPAMGDAGSGGLGRADARWVEMALEIMKEHEEESTPTKAKVLESIGPRLAARYPGEEFKLPKRSTAYGWLAELERRAPTFEVSAKRRRDIATRPVAAYGKLRPTRPGEYLLMDTTRLDVFALDPLTFQWVQPELTVAMDWYSRCVTGLRLTPVSTKSVDVAATLFQAYRPRTAGKDWPAHAVWPDHGIPRGIVLDRDAIEGPMADAAKPVGAASPALVPETLVVDHGKVYVSEHITSVCRRMGISIQPARLRTGRDKGPIERFFRTLREGLLQWLPAYKGPDVHSRGLNPEGEAFFFLNELEEIIREWVAVVYHHRPHDGLVDPQVPGLELSPAAMFDHGVARAGYIEVPRDADLAFEFLKTEWVPVHHYGVEIRRCRYRGDALVGLAGRTSPYTGPKAKGRWPVQVDPDDINHIYFRHPKTRRWSTLTWEHAPSVRFPISEEALELARKMEAVKYRYPDDKQAVASLLERWNLGLGMTAVERRMALRLARDQKALTLPPAEDTDPLAALPSLARALGRPTPGTGPATDEDDEAAPGIYPGLATGDDDDEEELDDTAGPDGEDFYADALEDV